MDHPVSLDGFRHFEGLPELAEQETQIRLQKKRYTQARYHLEIGWYPSRRMIVVVGAISSYAIKEIRARERPDDQL